MSTCPNSTASGCACPQHHPGLLAYAQDPTALATALERLKPRPRHLHAITTPPAPTGCTGAMTCTCRNCTQQRRNLTDREPTRQPWDPRPSRRAA